VCDVSVERKRKYIQTWTLSLSLCGYTQFAGYGIAPWPSACQKLALGVLDVLQKENHKNIENQ
jgi:hypothetical protein